MSNVMKTSLITFIYLLKRLGHNTILVYNFQAWVISGILSAMQGLEFLCLK